MQYKVKMSVDANADFGNYLDYIIYECDAPMTAAKHKAEILDALLELKKNPYINPIRHNESLREFGMNVRRVNYKKMAILYTIHDDVVYVHRILASSLITDL